MREGGRGLTLTFLHPGADEDITTIIIIMTMIARITDITAVIRNGSFVRSLYMRGARLAARQRLQDRVSWLFQSLFPGREIYSVRYYVIFGLKFLYVLVRLHRKQWDELAGIWDMIFGG